MPDITIIPNRNFLTGVPIINFVGASGSGISLQVLPNGQVSFYGTQGQLFSIADSLTGSLMAVTDSAGLPILEVFDSDRVVMGAYGASALVVSGSGVAIGVAQVNPSRALTISGDISYFGHLHSGNTNIVNLFATATQLTTTGQTLQTRITSLSGFTTTMSGALQTQINAGGGGGIGWASGANAVIYNTNNGNVGIGISTPQAKLHVRDTDDTYLLISTQDSNDKSISMGAGGTPLIARGAGGPLAFGTVTNNTTIAGWTEQMRLEANGNLGLGTSSPGNNKLYIHSGGGSAFNHNGYVLAVRGDIFGQVIQTDSSGTASALRVLTSGGALEALRVQNDGKIGVGTSSPVAELDIARNAQVWIRSGGGGGFPSSAGAGIKLEFNSAGGSISAYDYTNGVAKNLAVQTLGGNFGIGTMTPRTELDVRGSISLGTGEGLIYISQETSGNVSVRAGSNGTNAYYTFLRDGYFHVLNGGIKFPDGTTQTTAGGGGSAVGWASGSLASLYTTNNGSVVVGVDSVSTIDKMAVARNIGLYRHDGGNASLIFRTNTSNTDITAYLLKGPANTEMVWNCSGPIHIGTDNQSYYGLYTNGVWRMLVSSSGAFVIGGNTMVNTTRMTLKGMEPMDTFSPPSTIALDVQDGNGAPIFRVHDEGGVGFPLFVEPEWQASSPANVYTNGYYLYMSVSTSGSKRDIIDYEKSIADLEKLRPVSYKSKCKTDGERRFAGFIAEEVKQAGFDEFVTYGRSGDVIGVSYANITALLVNSIKELKREIEELKNKYENN